MENYQVLRFEQPRGPVYGTVIRANFQLGNRAARALSANIDEIRGIVAYGLSGKLGVLGVPADRTIRQWELDWFSYPEQMINAGMLSVNDILPTLRIYLSLNGYETLMQQASLSHLRSPVPSHTTKKMEPVSLLRSLGKISLFFGAIYLASSILKGADDPPSEQYIPSTEDSIRQSLSVSGRTNRYRRP